MQAQLLAYPRAPHQHALGDGRRKYHGFSLGLLYDLMGSGTIGCMALVLTLIAFIVGVAARAWICSHPS